MFQSDGCSTPLSYRLKTLGYKIAHFVNTSYELSTILWWTENMYREDPGDNDIHFLKNKAMISADPFSVAMLSGDLCSGPLAVTLAPQSS